MNYELLKLSKILPTIKGILLFESISTYMYTGKKIIDIYEESLEKARQAYYDQQDDSPQSGRTSERRIGHSSNLRGAVSSKHFKPEEPSASRLRTKLNFFSISM